MLRKIDFYEGRSGNIVGYALRLLALPFPRPGELAGGQWAHFDLDDAKWSVPFAELKQRTERKKNDKRVGEPFARGLQPRVRSWPTSATRLKREVEQRSSRSGEPKVVVRCRSAVLPSAICTLAGVRFHVSG